MRKYMIKLAAYKLPFAYIADIEPHEVPDAIKERFGVYPEWYDQ